MDGLLYLKDLSEENLKIVKILLKGKFTAIIVLNYFHQYIMNAKVKDFIYDNLIKEVKWIF